MLAPFIIGLAAIIWLAWIMRAGLVAARMFQIEEYETPRFLAWGRQRAWSWSTATLIASGTVLILALFMLALSTDLGRRVLAGSWLVGTILPAPSLEILASKKESGLYSQNASPPGYGTDSHTPSHLWTRFFDPDDASLP